MSTTTLAPRTTAPRFNLEANAPPAEPTLRRSVVVAAISIALFVTILVATLLPKWQPSFDVRWPLAIVAAAAFSGSLQAWANARHANRRLEAIVELLTRPRAFEDAPPVRGESHGWPMQSASETAAFLVRFSTQDRVRNERLLAAAEQGGWLHGDSGLGYFSLSFVAFLGAAWLLNWEATPPNFVCIGVLAAVALVHAIRGWLTARRANRRLQAVAEIVAHSAPA